MVESTVQPKGEKLRKVVKWISEYHLANPEQDRKKILEKAQVRFDLSPKDSEFLLNNFL